MIGRMLVTAFLYLSDVATLLYFMCIIVMLSTLLKLNDDDLGTVDPVKSA